jgi:hypothetical protein
MKADLGASVTHPRGTDAIGGAVGVSAGLDTEMVIAEVAAAYEFARWSGMTSPNSTTAFDFYAGGRRRRGFLQCNNTLPRSGLPAGNLTNII